MAVCLKGTTPINAGDQTTKIQHYKCNKGLPYLVSTVDIHTVIPQSFNSKLTRDLCVQT